MKTSEAVKYLVGRIDAMSCNSRDEAYQTMRAIAACAECVLVEGDVDVGDCLVAGLTWGGECWAICTDDDISIDAPDDDDEDDEDDENEDEDERSPRLCDLPVQADAFAIAPREDGQYVITLNHLCEGFPRQFVLPEAVVAAMYEEIDRAISQMNAKLGRSERERLAQFDGAKSGV